VTIPSTLGGKPVKQIGGDVGWPPAFAVAEFPNTNVTSVTISDGIAIIGAGAFWGSKALTNVSIPNSITNIEGDAFNECSALRRVIIPNSVLSVGSMAFFVCSSLTDVSIGNSVKSIGYQAFGHTGLTNVTIPSSVLKMDSDCFYNTPMQVINLPPHLLGSVGSIGLPGPLATSLLVKGVADQIIAALPSNYGIATKADLSSAASNAVAQVLANPSSYNLFTLAQNEARYNEGITAGTSLVTANPASYNLYTSDSIMDLRMNGLMVQKQGSNAVVSFQPQTTTDLTQPFTNNGTPITNTVPMPGNKGFLRIQAR